MRYDDTPAGYTEFGDISRERLGKQCQYGSRYIKGGMDGYPNLGHGLRFLFPDEGNYHSFLIHQDDVEEFVRRYKAYQAGDFDVVATIHN